MDLEAIRIYLEDHQAGAAAGAKLARRIAERNENSPRAAALREFADAVEDDAATLQRLREAIAVPDGATTAIKRTIATAAEALSRLELGSSHGGLDRALESEAMIAGVAAKRCLWSALAVTEEIDGEFAALTGDFDFDDLSGRARAQLDVLHSLHRDAVAAAFSGTSGRPADA